MVFYFIYPQVAHQAYVLFQNKMTDFLLQALIIILELNEFLLHSRVAHEGTIAAQIMASE